ncbi:MAG: hypothetical protein M1828_000398 [Chrysothrix sp. TS-e1954]|nr:MAG: hypothetical protein M1828_000398 [Chrysothrix sp. TS-e1954]
MEAVSIIGCIAAIQQLLTTAFEFGKAVRDAEHETDHLRSELSALKAALERVRSIKEGASSGIESDEGSPTYAPIYSSPESEAVLLKADELLKSLQASLSSKNGKVKSSMQRFLWPGIKGAIERDVQKLERIRNFFTFATTSDNYSLCKEVYQKICDVDRKLQNQANVEKSKQVSDLRKDIKTWLAPYDPNQLLERSLELLQSGTGTWFLEGIFQDFLEHKTAPALWLRAKPGTGKTVLLSAAIDRFQRGALAASREQYLAFFFCSFSDQATQDLRNLLGSLLVQLCEAEPALWRPVEDFFAKNKGSLAQSAKRLDVPELENLLIESFETLPHTLIVLDALNESKRSLKILESLTRLLQRSSSLQIIISSTEDLTNVSPALQATTVTLEQAKTAADITKYIEATIEDNENLCLLPDSLKGEIKLALQQKTEGVFRWVRCQLETLSNVLTPREIREALRNVPGTLEKTYRAILARVPAPHEEMTKRALFWLAFAVRPPSLEELCEAVIIDEDTDTVDTDARLIRKETLLQVCGSLISYDLNTTRVILAHSSVFDYLTSNAILKSDVKTYYIDDGVAGNRITRLCLTYMLLPAFSTGSCVTQEMFAQREQEWPLMYHAARTIYDYLRYIVLDEETTSLLLRFFATHQMNQGGNFQAWCGAYYPRDLRYDKWIKESTPLAFATCYWSSDVARLILEKGDKSAHDQPGRYSLQNLFYVAVAIGRTAVVRIRFYKNVAYSQFTCWLILGGMSARRRREHGGTRYAGQHMSNDGSPIQET